MTTINCRVRLYYHWKWNEDAPSSTFTAQMVQHVVKCTECSKPRCVFSTSTLATPYVQSPQCFGSPGVLLRKYPSSQSAQALWKGVFFKLALRCYDLVKLTYYSSKLNIHSVCCYCAGKDATKPQEYTAKFFTAPPICAECMAVKPVITPLPRV